MIGPTYLRARDPLGLLVWEATARRGRSCAPTRARTCCAGSCSPRETQVFSGNEVARTQERRNRVRRHPALDARRPAEAHQLARERARGDLWVNESHPERNTDVILFVDSFTEARLRRRGNTRPRSARHRDARGRLCAAPRPGRADRRSAASCAGSSPAPASCSSTASSMRCSTRRSSSRTTGRRST